MKLNEVISAANFHVTGGSVYGWKCYGNSRYMDFSDVNGNEDVVNCVYSPTTQEVFEVQAWINDDNVVYSWRNPEYKKAYKAEAKARNVDPNNAYDDVQFTKVKTEEEILDLVSRVIHGTYVHSKALVEHEYVGANGMKVKILTSSSNLTPQTAWPFPTGGPSTGCCGGCHGDESECGGGCDEEESNWNEVHAGNAEIDDFVAGLDSDRTFIDELELDELEAEIDRKATETEWEVVLTTKHRLDIKARNYEEAVEKARAFKENVKVKEWGEGVCWVDHWISKETVSKRVCN